MLTRSIAAGCAALPLLLAGCGGVPGDPFAKPGTYSWTYSDSYNLAAMVAYPSDLRGRAGDETGNSDVSDRAVLRLRIDRVKKLPDSGVAQFREQASSDKSGGETAPSR